MITFNKWGLLNDLMLRDEEPQANASQINLKLLVYKEPCFFIWKKQGSFEICGSSTFLKSWIVGNRCIKVSGVNKN